MSVPWELHWPRSVSVCNGAELIVFQVSRKISVDIQVHSWFLGGLQTTNTSSNLLCVLRGGGEAKDIPLCSGCAATQELLVCSVGWDLPPSPGSGPLFVRGSSSP